MFLSWCSGLFSGGKVRCRLWVYGWWVLEWNCVGVLILMICLVYMIVILFEIFMRRDRLWVMKMIENLSFFWVVSIFWRICCCMMMLMVVVGLFMRIRFGLYIKDSVMRVCCCMLFESWKGKDESWFVEILIVFKSLVDLVNVFFFVNEGLWVCWMLMNCLDSLRMGLR